MDSQYNTLYEAALKKQPGTVRRVLKTIWLIAGLSALSVFAWAEPWSAKLFQTFLANGVSPPLINYVLVPLVMAFRGMVLVEAIGYAYHRFFQHVGFFTRAGQVFRNNQRYHWTHHMLIYPIGKSYRRAGEYVGAEPGIGLSWAIPALTAAGLFLITHGLNIGSISFIAGIAIYASGLINTTHSRFHEINHPWAKNWYFQWLERIHELHHWDQRCNFTILHPTMDILFGTFLNPATHASELRMAVDERELTVSDIINWRYLLIEATPAEYAAFVSKAKMHPPSIRKIKLLLAVFNARVQSHAQDPEARTLQVRAQDLLRQIA